MGCYNKILKNWVHRSIWLLAKTALVCCVYLGSEATAVTYTVNSLLDTDDGSCDSRSIADTDPLNDAALDCTFREAVTLSNSNVGSDTIEFSIPGGVSQPIVPASGFVISDALVINGETDPSFVERPVIEIDCPTTFDHCLSISAGSNSVTVRGLAFLNAKWAHIRVNNVDGLVIQNNHFGIGSDGVSTHRPTHACIELSAGDNVTIGGPSDSDGNYFATGSKSSLFLGSDYPGLGHGGAGFLVQNNRFNLSRETNPTYLTHNIGWGNILVTPLDDEWTDIEILDNWIMGHPGGIVFQMYQWGSPAGLGATRRVRIEGNHLNVMPDGSTIQASTGVSLKNRIEDVLIKNNAIAGSQFYPGIEVTSCCSISGPDQFMDTITIEDNTIWDARNYYIRFDAPVTNASLLGNRLGLNLDGEVDASANVPNFAVLIAESEVAIGDGTGSIGLSPSGCGIGTGCNLISNANYGVYIDPGSRVSIDTNIFGLDTSGHAAGFVNDGISIRSEHVDIYSNWIGHAQGNGIYMDEYAHLTIGGLGQENIMYNHGGSGLECESNEENDVVVGPNLYQGNGDIAFDLDANGVTKNDSGDVDGGMNGNLNMPLLMRVQDLGSGQVRLEGWVEPNVEVRVYQGILESTPFGQGYDYLGSFSDDNALGIMTLDDDAVSASTAVYWDAIAGDSQTAKLFSVIVDGVSDLRTLSLMAYDAAGAYGVVGAVSEFGGIVNDLDQDGLPGFLDADSDNDGVSDRLENPTLVDPFADSDADGVPLMYDANDPEQPGCSDLNSDGICDNGSTTAPKISAAFDSDGDGIADLDDLDSDNDGIVDSLESGHGLDADRDGRIDFLSISMLGTNGFFDDLELVADEGSPRFALMDTDGDGTADVLDLDSDGDGLFDSDEGLSDPDSDGIPKAYDPDESVGSDSDDDGFTDAEECLSGWPCIDSDNDGIPDYMEQDSDNDGVNDEEDSDSQDACVPNAWSISCDSDGDGVLNVDDVDDDNDGVLDLNEVVLSVSPSGDADGDGVPNWIDADDRGDGTAASCDDSTPNDGRCDTLSREFDLDGDGDPNHLDLDSDGDGLFDSVEHGVFIDADADGVGDAQASAIANIDGSIDADLDSDFDTDVDSDGLPNGLDLDSDGDSKTDQNEGLADADGDGTPNYLDADDANPCIPVIDIEQCTSGGEDPNLDSDGDGITDVMERYYGLDEYSPLVATGGGSCQQGLGRSGLSWLLCLLSAFWLRRRKAALCVPSHDYVK